MRKVKPQKGPQTAFLSSPADVAFYGGAAGGGKTWALLLEPLRHITDVDGFGAVIFRRLSPQITNEGGLWDESLNLYSLVGGTGSEYRLRWRFPPFNNAIQFAHMQYEQDRISWQGAQIPLIMWDELTHFTRKQFFYMFSRNRSLCGVRPYIRATYNPVPPDDPVGGWIHEFVGWYLDEAGYPDPLKSGVVRWFVMDKDELAWFATRSNAVAYARQIGMLDAESAPKSFTYIASTVFDNQILLQADPGYLANLKALPLVEQEQLLNANHFAKPEAGKVFNKSWFPIVDAVPAGGVTVRFWDMAATEKKAKGSDPDWTVGLKLTRVAGRYYVEDIWRHRIGPAEQDRAMQNIAHQDGRSISVGWEIEPGSSGKRVEHDLYQLFAGFVCQGRRPTGDKLQRAKAAAAQAYAGNISLVRGDWNGAFLSELHQFPDGAHDDQVDGLSGAFNMLLELPDPQPYRPQQTNFVSRAQMAATFGI